MSTPHSDWMNGLSPSGRPAPEPPAAFLAVVRTRRIRRRMRQASVAAGVLMVAGLAAVFMPRSEPGPIRPMAVRPTPAPVAVNPVRGTTDERGPAILSVAMLYVSGKPLDPDHLPTATVADSRPEQSIRGGDRWDPDQVKSWLSN